MGTRYCALLFRLACPSCLLDGLKLDALLPTVVGYEASFTLAACGPFCLKGSKRPIRASWPADP